MSSASSNMAVVAIAGPANATTGAGVVPPEEATSLLRELSFWDVGGATTTTQPQQQSPPMDGNTVQQKESILLTSTNPTTSTTSSATTTPVDVGEEEERAAAKWKTATDPATGKIYYYDVVTRKTQWEKVCMEWFYFCCWMVLVLLGPNVSCFGQAIFFLGFWFGLSHDCLFHPSLFFFTPSFIFEQPSHHISSHAK
jgi:hypothetical protein